MRKPIVIILLVAAGSFPCAVARAQRAQGSYMPSKPTLSPYLWLTKPNQGVFPNYQTYVQPLQNQAQVNRDQQSNTQNIQMGQQQLQTQQLQLQQNQAQQQQQLQQQGQWRITPASVAPTGIGAGYNNMSHYYGGAGGTGGGGSGGAAGGHAKGKTASSAGGR